MGRRCIKKDTYQDIYPDEQALHAKKRLQKIHFSSHPLAGRSCAADRLASGLEAAVDLPLATPSNKKQTFTSFIDRDVS
jgi:hypothetical protein